MKIVLDLAKENWDLDISDISKNYQPQDNIEIDFIDNGNNYVEFKNLSFGFILKEGEEVLYDVSFPPENVIYISTDQDYLESYYIEGLKPDTDYVMDVWTINDGKHFSDSFSFSIPRPPKPGPLSEWDYENNVWMPSMDSARIRLIIESQIKEQENL